jgi:hypothetical protein
MSETPLQSFVNEVAARFAADMVSADEHHPHVLVAFDPTLVTSDAPWLGCGSSCIGPFPDLHSALAAADEWSASLNAGAAETPFRIVALAVRPVSDAL